MSDRCSWKQVSSSCEVRCIYRCISCGLHHVEVEAGGIYWCPTPGCTVSGAAWWRQKLDSYTENLDGTHSVDPLEALIFAAKYELTDPAIIEARKAACEKWLDRIDYDKLDVTEYLPVLTRAGLALEVL